MKQYDELFLQNLYRQKNKTIYARITTFQLNNLPIEQIEGQVSQGSINIDGDSAVRRTCSLTLISEDFSFNEYYWGLHTKFQLEIGINNNIDSKYPDIIWFKEGIFIITSFSCSKSTNNLTITIQGKDKMCLLNGEVGGTLESSVDFGTIEEVSGDTVNIRKVPIKDIIKNMLFQYAEEPYHNIIINDLDDYGLELLEYRGSSPLYIFKKDIQGMDQFPFATTNGEMACSIVNPSERDSEAGRTGQITELRHIGDNDWKTTYDTINEGLLGKSNSIAQVSLNPSELTSNEQYSVIRINYGQTAGYNTTELVFAGDLIANIGETLTSILDKIKNMLGNYEYFYDVDGRFVFQQKPSIEKRAWVNVFSSGLTDLKDENDDTYLEQLAQQKSKAYNFLGTELITSFNHTPNFGDVKNDFAIWGQRNSSSGGTIPIHLRYAIDKKPTEYTSISVSEDEVQAYNEKYKTNLSGQESKTYRASTQFRELEDGTIECDWREILYQMASDYFKYNWLDDFFLRLSSCNPEYINGRTNYEQYYTDIEGFWRELYNPDVRLDDYKNILLPKENYYIPTEEDMSATFSSPERQYAYWNKAIIESPENLNFWFDFLDSNSELEKYSVSSIGRRTKSINETTITAIFQQETPNIIFVPDLTNYQDVTSGSYSYLQASNNYFSVSTQGISAFDKLDDLLQQHTICSENVSITTLPIYHLEPNTRIYISDQDIGINGDYLATKFSIPLSHNGTMSITAQKVINNII